MLRKIVLALAILLGLLVIIFVNTYALAIGMGVIFLGTVYYAFTNPDKIDRGRWFFVIFFTLLTAVIALFLPIEGETLLAARFWSLAIGAVISFIVTSIFFFLSVYTASIQILLSNKDEDLSVWDAVRSTAAVMLGTNQEWLVISEGGRARTNARGLLKKWGGPGKIIVEPGNAIILQRGGRITGVHGAGVTLTRKAELIREIFDLRNQFKIQELRNVITADQIPLTIELGVGYKIKPADKLDAPGVLKDNKGGFPVEEETLLRAAFNNTPGKWFGLGAGAPTVQLRDQIMARTVDQLFTPTGNPATRAIKKIEDDIKKAVNNFVGGKGIKITAVDIRQITLPEDVKEALTKARANTLIEEGKNRATQDLLQQVLDTISEYTDAKGPAELDMARTFIEALKLAEARGTKIFSVGSNTPVIKNPITIENAPNQ